MRYCTDRYQNNNTKLGYNDKPSSNILLHIKSIAVTETC